MSVGIIKLQFNFIITSIQHLMLPRVRILILLFILVGCNSPNETTKEAQKNTTVSNEEPKQNDEKKKSILFFGDSITAGYQLDLDMAFPALLQKRLDSLGYSYECINAGLSGETSAGGRGRIDWVLRNVPDIFFLELGANDGLRGLPLEETPQNLQAIIDAVKKENPEVKIIVAGMMVPPNLGNDYTTQFKEIFPSLAEKNNATYIPFLLEGVAGDPSLNLNDGIHPTPDGHKILAETVWKYLEPLL